MPASNGSPRSASDDPGARRLARAFAALVALTYGLIVLGALVRAHDAGLSCPDWPLCFGEWIPAFDLRIAFEYTHRLVAGGVGVLFVTLSILTLRQASLRAVAARWIAVAAALLALQVLLGALTVWHLLASWTVTSHLLTANAFAVSLLLLQRRLAEAADPPAPRPPAGSGLRAGVSAAGAVLLLQVALGGLVSSRYAGLACSEWPTCNDGRFFPGFQGALGIHLAHRTAGYALICLLGACAWAGRRRDDPLRRLLLAACGVGLVQVGLGVANVLLRLPVEVTALHSAGAAALVLLVALSLREVWARPLAQPSPAQTRPAVLHRVPSIED
jgi:cytochrome c oxidase assembly protein subunit 15